MIEIQRNATEEGKVSTWMIWTIRLSASQSRCEKRVSVLRFTTVERICCASVNKLLFINCEHGKKGGRKVEVNTRLFKRQHGITWETFHGLHDVDFYTIYEDIYGNEAFYFR